MGGKTFADVGDKPEPWFGSFSGIKDRALLKELLSKARDALQREDEALKGAFERAASERHATYEGANHGLLYWVFETTLVYAIFKEWIPLADTLWESAYQQRSNTYLDLRVRPVPARSWGFEAKWWQQSTKKYTEGLMNDAQRLLDADDLDERFLLTFWCSPTERWRRDLEEVGHACNEARLHRHANAKVRPIYVGTFGTHVVDSEGKPWYFALGVLRVTKE